MSVCVGVTLRNCVGNVGDRLKESQKRGGCDDSSSTCCLSHGAPLSQLSLSSSAGDEATFLTSLT